MILFLHNRYRVSGGEERVVAEQMRLVGERLGEPVRLLERQSASLSRREAAAGLVLGGLRAAEVSEAVRSSGADVVHAHNLHPAFGWRALEAARRANAAVVVQLHQFRLVCAVGVCFTQGAECVRCHGRNTLPGLLRGCRGSIAEATTYSAALALWQRRTIAAADVFVLPSRFALQQLHAMGVELPEGQVRIVPPPLHDFAERSRAAAGSYALLASRLVAEKGVEVAIEACSLAGVPLTIAGEGPDRDALQARARLGAGAGRVRFVGPVNQRQLAQLRRDAAVALAPSVMLESFGMAVAEAMAAGLPVLASRRGAPGELLPDQALVPASDAEALSAAIGRLWGDEAAGERNLAQVRALCAPDQVAAKLAGAYAMARDRAQACRGAASPRRRSGAATVSR